jgi:hypothetical protein
MHRTRLRGSPVRHVVDVWADGELLPRSSYVLLDSSVLGLTGLASCNIRCLTVRYIYGTGVPPGGRMAAVKLATEMLEGMRGGPCKLPERVTSVSRQGLSWTLLDPQDFLDQGRTGIYEVDMLIRALNPARALAPARVFSPDLMRGQTVRMSEPPLSVLLQPNDQLVVRGSGDALWTSSDPSLVAAVRMGHRTSTTITAGRGGAQVASTPGPWELVAGDSPGAVLGVTADVVRAVSDGDVYTVTDIDGDRILISGLVRVI